MKKKIKKLRTLGPQLNALYVECAVPTRRWTNPQDQSKYDSGKGKQP